MARILVFQHVPYEPLGTLDPLIRERKHRIKYVNFGREPLAEPSLQGYQALIILGGPMNIGEEALFPHLEVEKKLILQAIDEKIPVLGICLGAQLIASASGANVYSMANAEIGWYPLQATNQGHADPVFHAFGESEPVFQWHAYTFDLPGNATRLITAKDCPNQAFKIGSNVYGFQFHLEADLALIQRWLKLPLHQRELVAAHQEDAFDKIWRQSEINIRRSLELSRQVFGGFLDLLPGVNEQHRFNHRQF